MSTSRITLAVMALLALENVSAAIVEDGLWTGNDWYDNDIKIGVQNGVPYSNDWKVDRRIKAPLSIDGSIEETYMTKDNVVRVQSLFSEQQFIDGFPQADPVYTYDNFLKAVAKFPNFCNETNMDGQTLDETCKRELATIFAHWGQETGKRDPSNGENWTQALYWVQEIRCNMDTNGGRADPSCDYKQAGWSDDAWPAQEGAQYFGRGPFQLSWNYNYGRFSNIFAPSSYNSRLYLLENPQFVHEDGFLTFAAGIWFYMSPQDPKPSMHDVITGFYEPNATDLAANFTRSFGTTINVINGGIECGRYVDKAASRGEYYSKWLEFFDMPAEGDLGCANQASSFPFGGASDVPGYWTQAWNGEIACKPAGYQTKYDISARDDYKRCICDHFGDGEADCPQSGEAGPDPEPTPKPDDYEESSDEEEVTPQPDEEPEESDEENDSNPWKPTWDTLEEIRANPHYSEDHYSRTMYQVDREIDFIEKKLVEIFTVAHENGLL